MPYNQFSIEQIKLNFGIEIREKYGLFSNISEVDYSSFLAEILEKFVPLALEIDTQKSRSEYITAPILFELKSQFSRQITLLSGNDFTVDPEKGLSGTCDFLISYSSPPMVVEAPCIVLAEAKQDNLLPALGECMAKMLAAQLVNRRRRQDLDIIYGCVTTGTDWKFLQLVDQRIEIDLQDYSISNLGQLFGIFHYCIEQLE